MQESKDLQDCELMDAFGKSKGEISKPGPIENVHKAVEEVEAWK